MESVTNNLTGLAFTARVALLQDELAGKTERASKLEAQVTEMAGFRDEALSARERLEELREKVAALEDALLKARRSASDARAKLRHTEDDQEQLVQDATIVAEFLGRGTINEDTRPALRRLIA